MTNFDFGKVKEHALTKPRDKAWDNWASFEKVGDFVQGLIVDVFARKAEGDFKDQRGITLQQEDGTLINVGIKRIDFVLDKTDNLRLGDPLRIELEKETPHAQKGYSAIKVFGFYGTNLPENAGNKTVKQLDDMELGILAEEKAKSDAEFDGEPAAVVTAPVAATAADVPFPSPSDTPVETPVDTAAEVATPTETATTDSEKTA